MTGHPILFSAPMVRALLDGRKTMTRRVLKPQPFIDQMGNFCAPDQKGKVWNYGQHLDGRPCTRNFAAEKVRVSVGDRLWVREGWWIATRYSYGTTPGGLELPSPPLARRRSNPVFYAADGNPPNCKNRHYGPDGLRGGSFAAPDPYAVWVRRPSIHMPRWASRLTLIVTDVHVARLQDISEADAIAEGVERDSDGWRDYLMPHTQCCASATDSFGALWDSINGPGAWEANPWVSVTGFDVYRQSIDQMGAA